REVGCDENQAFAPRAALDREQPHDGPAVARQAAQSEDGLRGIRDHTAGARDARRAGYACAAHHSAGGSPASSPPAGVSLAATTASLVPPAFVDAAAFFFFVFFFFFFFSAGALASVSAAGSAAAGAGLRFMPRPRRSG